MALVNNVAPVREAVPHEDGEWIEFRPLSGAQLRKAAREKQLGAADLLKAFGGDVFKAMRESNVSGEDVAAAARDPLNDYDTDMLLRESITGWSYDLPVKGNTANLDEPTERWALGVIARVSGLADETDDERGNGS
jgi:hypothetical protein